MSGFDDDDERVGNVRLLQERITALSIADDFRTARFEWKLQRIELADEYGQQRCLCEHRIKELCWVRNTLNGNVALLGNVCVNRFIGVPSALVFDGLRRIMSDPTAAPNEALAVFCRDCGIINDWEYRFLGSTARKRKPTAKELTTRMGLSRCIVDHCTKPRNHP